MLRNLKRWLMLHLQAISTSTHSLWRKPFSTALTILVISITLVLPALFWVLTDNFERLSKEWQQSGHISLYLESKLSKAAESDLLLKVRETVGVATATLTSAEEGLQELAKQEGMQDILNYLPENPLPAVIEVTPELNINQPSQLNQLYSQLKSYVGVEQAQLDKEWIKRMHVGFHFFNTLSHALIIILALAVVLIIGHSLRFVIQDHYEEIRVLKLIGASDAFIIRPFLYAGVWYGLVGSLVAILFVLGLVFYLTKMLREFAAHYHVFFSFVGLSFSSIFLIILGAIVLGWLGARLSVKRQLVFIEPYN